MNEAKKDAEYWKAYSHVYTTVFSNLVENLFPQIYPDKEEEMKNRAKLAEDISNSDDMKSKLAFAQGIIALSKKTGFTGTEGTAEGASDAYREIVDTVGGEKYKFSSD